MKGGQWQKMVVMKQWCTMLFHRRESYSLTSLYVNIHFSVLHIDTNLGTVMLCGEIV
jgi:hypothetical protein